MSTLLRGTTNTEDASKLSMPELNLELKGYKEEKASFLIEIADRDFTDFKGQVQDTITFLTNNRGYLKGLKTAIQSLSWCIDFGYNSKITTGELAVENLMFPLELLKLCTELSIELNISLYDAQLFDFE